ncbi:hypothetical protein BCR39DRAFT_225999 [Naematelia encephala]|uniref:Uncharacterized protein n=1 Tax=Naematelia encephala TaxID=71784 RepID=A0A1Y2AXX5_9TREE|nr:hypothetical protein BCR39DRAFT_225999 [Naematelia encephala]
MKKEDHPPSYEEITTRPIRLRQTLRDRLRAFFARSPSLESNSASNSTKSIDVKSEGKVSQKHREDAPQKPKEVVPKKDTPLPPLPTLPQPPLPPLPPLPVPSSSISICIIIRSSNVNITILSDDYLSFATTGNIIPYSSNNPVSLDSISLWCISDRYSRR